MLRIVFDLVLKLSDLFLLDLFLNHQFLLKLVFLFPSGRLFLNLRMVNNERVLRHNSRDDALLHLSREEVGNHQFQIGQRLHQKFHPFGVGQLFELFLN